MLHNLREKLLTLECMVIQYHQVWTSSRWWDRQYIESRPLTWSNVPSFLTMSCLSRICLCPCFLPDISHNFCTYVYSPGKTFLTYFHFQYFLQKTRNLGKPVFFFQNRRFFVISLLLCTIILKNIYSQWKNFYWRTLFIHGLIKY